MSAPVPMYDAVIVGGGPAGMFCAIHCARAGLRACLVEKNPRPGKKLLISGSGRCNITHAGAAEDFLRHYGTGRAFVKPALMNYTGADLVAFFRKRGLEMIEMAGGKIFPATQNARDVLRVLTDECGAAGVLMRLGEPVLRASALESVPGFGVSTASASFAARALVIATGGRSYPSTGSTGDGYAFARSFGHALVTPSPALAPLIIQRYAFSGCAGISLNGVRITLFRDGKQVAAAIGDVLFTHRGLSGPAILDLSRHVRPGDVIALAAAGFASTQEFERHLRDAFSAHGRKSVKSHLLATALPERLAARVLSLNGIDGSLKASVVDRATRRRIASAFMELSFAVDRPGGYNEAMATAGGVSLPEINATTMESRLVKGLYFAGEVVDIDGDTGGYNLQWAFSSGKLAADAIARSIGERRRPQKFAEGRTAPEGRDE